MPRFKPTARRMSPWKPPHLRTRGIHGPGPLDWEEETPSHAQENVWSRFSEYNLTTASLDELLDYHDQIIGNIDHATSVGRSILRWHVKSLTNVRFLLESHAEAAGRHGEILRVHLETGKDALGKILGLR